MKGLQGKNEFRKEYTAAQMEILERLAEIEQEDEDRCASCGGGILSITLLVCEMSAIVQ